MEKLIKFLSIPAGWFTHFVRIGLGLGVVCIFLLHSSHFMNIALVESFEGALYDLRLRATMPQGTYDKVDR